VIHNCILYEAGEEETEKEIKASESISLAGQGNNNYCDYW